MSGLLLTSFKAEAEFRWTFPCEVYPATATHPARLLDDRKRVHRHPGPADTLDLYVNEAGVSIPFSVRQPDLLT